MRLSPLVAALALACLVGACAFSRPEVKSLRDPTADRVQFDSVILTSVSALNAIPSQCGPAGNHRVRPEEFHVYQVVGTIAKVLHEPDHDYHVVITDLEHPRDHMVVESNDPDFGGNAVSPYRERLAAGRRMFDALVAESGAQHLSDLKGTAVRVTGVGFFDVTHLQPGRSRSCIELHPILAIERLIVNGEPKR